VGQGLAAHEQRRAERAGRVHRCAVERDADQVDSSQGEPDGETGEARCSRPPGDQQDHGDEHEGQQHLEQERPAGADRRSVVVGAERTGLVGHVAEAAGEQLQQGRAGDATGELSKSSTRRPRAGSSRG
jgi:hypothetical protein